MKNGKIVKKKLGRISKFNEKTVNKLVSIIKLGGSIERACLYAKVSKQGLYQQLKKNDNLLDEINSAKEYSRILAEKTLHKSMKDYKLNKDLAVKSASWWLERRYPQEYGANPPLVNIDQRSISNYIEFVPDNPDVIDERGVKE